MKTAKMILAGVAAVYLTCSGAFAQQMMTGTISKIDEAGGKIAIQPAQTGTVGANTAGAAEDLKVQDGLIFNAFKVGDKVSFATSEVGGVKTLTKLEKQ